jgi:hypothetical protein
MPGKVSNMRKSAMFIVKNTYMAIFGKRTQKVKYKRKKYQRFLSLAAKETELYNPLVYYDV